MPVAAPRIIVVGAGFAGVWSALSAQRLINLRDKKIQVLVVVVESSSEIGPDLGPGPRPTILEALADLGVELRLGSAVTSIDAHGVTLASGERIDAMTAIWTAGVRATPLARQVPGPRDPLGRLHVDRHLRVLSSSSGRIFATGDAARAIADKGDNAGQHRYALMSCQHANVLGRVSGHNGAADLLGVPAIEYAQPEYNCCLDLGAWGAVLGAGWDREVKMTRHAAKQVKTFINQQLIYPPLKADEAIAASDPLPYLAGGGIPVGS